MNRKHTKGWMKHGDFIIIDIILLQLCYVLAYILTHGISNPYAGETFQELALLMSAGQLLVILFSSHYRSILGRKSINELISIIIYSVEILAITLVFLFTIKKSSDYSRLQVFITLSSFIILDFVAKQLNKVRILRSLRRESNQRQLVLVTSRRYVEEAVRKLNESVTKNIHIKAVVLMDGFDARKELGKTGKTGRLPEDEKYTFRGVDRDCLVMPLSKDALTWISHEWVDGVFVLQPADQMFPQELMDGLIKMGITMYYSITALDDSRWPAVDLQKLGGYKVLTSSVKFISTGWLVLKRGIDIVGGLVGCIFTLLLTIFIGPMIYFKSPGPIFFKQERIGRNGKPFKIYKFRSMYMDAEERKAALMEQNKMQGLMFKMDDDPRIIGSEKKDKNGKPKGIGNFIRKTSIDEFPQFLNVLIGNMSLVGWRPCTMNEWKEYGLEHRSRAGMKPGITGMWQVSGRSEITDFDEVVKLDQEYIENWSLLLDIKILFKTVGVVLLGKGAE